MVYWAAAGKTAILWKVLLLYSGSFEQISNSFSVVFSGGLLPFPLPFCCLLLLLIYLYIIYNRPACFLSCFRETQASRTDVMISRNDRLLSVININLLLLAFLVWLFY